MIVFVLYLHICATQTTSMRGGAPAKTVTACSSQPTGTLYGSKAACDKAGDEALALPAPGVNTGDTVRKTDAYECRSQSVAS